ncbi:MAG TPA: hypothetical protein VLJ39_05910 [Tepidisphaeraceae bacterium]|jgi:hypothetical protein|nr:hypothetical protein [Tepidisphaeraceae bacterium]
MTQTNPTPPIAEKVRRSIRRIVVEGVFVAVLGAIALGLFWEAFSQDAGWVAAAIIWITGGPILEIVRVIQERRTGSS